MKNKISVLLSFVLIISSIPVSFTEMSLNMTVKPLVVLMDYRDYDHSELVRREDDEHVTGDHYDSYEKDLYEDILFGYDTYTSVDGNDYMTFRSYYNKLSHGVLDIDGTVFGWYTASGDAKDYGCDNNNTGTEQDDSKPLIEEAVESVVLDNPYLDLSQFDVMDPTDHDGDGNMHEPDGELDVVIVIHAGRGEEYGGGSLGEDAIWPVSNKFSYSEDDRNMRPEIAYASTSIYLNEYIVIEQDFPVSLVAHEFAHYLGLPDLYRSGGDGTVEHYSNMSAGYPGEVPGSLIPSVGGYCRDALQQLHGGDWARTTNLHLDDIDSSGVDLMLSAASSEYRDYDDLIRIDLPEKVTKIVNPPSGDKCYFTGRGNDLENSMSIGLDLTGARKAQLNFSAWYDIDPEFDYVSIQVREAGGEWESIKGNITTTDNPNDDTPNDPTDRNPGHGITNDSGGKWLDAEFNLRQYAGEEIELKFFWWTDGNTVENGMYIDDIEIRKDGEVIVSDDADGSLEFDIDGFEVSDGTIVSGQYYLLEWRNHEGVDENLTRIKRDFEESVANKGLIVWYIDELYMDPAGKHDQDTASHPGHSFASVIDAGQYPTMYRYYGEDEVINDKDQYQRHDAAFSLRREPEFILPWTYVETVDVDSRMQPVFDDSFSYYDDYYDVLGVLQPEFGLQFFVLEENADSTEAMIHVRRGDRTTSHNTFDTDLDFSGVEIENGQMTVYVNGEDLEDEATAIFINERFPNIIQTDVVLENEGNTFTAQLPIEGSDHVGMIIGNSYFSGVGDDLDNSMVADIDLTGVSSAELSFKTWFDIDPLFDFGSVKVREKGTTEWESIKGNITTTENPNDETPRDKGDRNPGHGITKDSVRVWTDAEFDLSDYAGQEIELGIFFWSDSNTDEFGMFVDDIQVIGNGQTLFYDDAEGESKFILDGFEKSEMTYRLAHIVFERQDGRLTALYNKDVYKGYGVDLTPEIIGRIGFELIDDYPSDDVNVTPVSGGAIEVPLSNEVDEINELESAKELDR